MNDDDQPIEVELAPGETLNRATILRFMLRTEPCFVCHKPLGEDIASIGFEHLSGANGLQDFYVPRYAHTACAPLGAILLEFPEARLAVSCAPDEYTDYLTADAADPIPLTTVPGDAIGSYGPDAQERDE